jgi:error-prone DNA polymerase
VEGKLQKEGEVIHVIVKRCYDLSGLLIPLVLPKDTDYLGKPTFDENAPTKKERETAIREDVFYKGRNFH